MHIVQLQQLAFHQRRDTRPGYADVWLGRAERFHHEVNDLVQPFTFSPWVGDENVVLDVFLTISLSLRFIASYLSIS